MKYNKPNTIEQTLNQNPTRTTNYEGGLAFQPSDRTDLVLRAATSLMGEDKFYADGSKLDVELIKLIHKVASNDPEFVLKLAVYCRNILHLRSVPLVLLAETANTPRPTIPHLRRYVPHIIQRPDEITELLAYQYSRNLITKRLRAKTPMLIQNGLAVAFNRFNEYQFGKYNRKDASVTLRDAIFICHPLSVAKNEEQKLLYRKIIDGTLATPETWEVTISREGNNKAAWESIIPKMGYMALLRNLRNFIQAGVDLNKLGVLNTLRNPTAVQRNRQLPFRYYSAFRELASITIDPFLAQPVLLALEDALKLSVANIPTVHGRTFILIDLSGSMEHPLGKYSSITYKDLSSLLGAMAHHIFQQSIVGVFADNFRIVNTNPQDSILRNKETISNTNVGGSTYAYKGFEYLNQTKLQVDRIILLSDMQCYNDRPGYSTSSTVAHQFLQYQRSINPKAWLYSIDLSGYGSLQVPEDNKQTSLIAGWSENIFRYINMNETDKTTMIDDINRIEVFDIRRTESASKS